MPQTILPLFPQEATPITDLVSFSKRDGTVWYFHGCFPVFSHGEDDYASFSMYTSQLVVTGHCKQVDIVKAFGVSTISVKRHVKKFKAGGPAAFFKQPSKKRCTVWTPEKLRQAQKLLDEDKTREEVVVELKVKPDTLYRAIHSGRLVERKKKRNQQE